MLEEIQERALRFVYDDLESTYEALLNKANIPFLHIKKLRTMAIEICRILNNMSPVLSDLVRVRERVLPIISDIIIFCRCRRFVQQNTVRKVSGLRQRFCGTSFQIILDKKAVLINFKF